MRMKRVNYLSPTVLPSLPPSMTNLFRSSNLLNRIGVAQEYLVPQVDYLISDSVQDLTSGENYRQSRKQDRIKHNFRDSQEFQD